MVRPTVRCATVQIAAVKFQFELQRSNFNEPSHRRTFGRTIAPSHLSHPRTLRGHRNDDWTVAFVGYDGDRWTRSVTDFLLEVGVLRPSDASYFEQQVLAAFTRGVPFYRWQTPGVPPGMYWARFRTKNDCGLSVPSFITSFTLR
jgi:hypothetical protein